MIFSFTLSFFSPLLFSQNSFALSGGDFQAGRIIDDIVFTNKNSMSVQQIQNFLNAEVPICDRNHIGFTGASGTAYNPPWTCLKEYNENPYTLQNNIGKFNADGSPYQVPGGQSAAQIIWNAGQQYNINPQVILATLQKESGIVTDNWAASWQYKTAMGYACPDSGPNNTANCSSQYYGFYNQVTSAAWQFNQYMSNPSAYNFQGNVTRYIQFSPDTTCGGSNIFIKNSSTAALYNYTPYQPNTGSLNGLSDTSPGGAATCGAYGNRNFWWYFNEWFGNTLAANYTAQAYSQSNYPVITAGQCSSGTFFEYQNIGNVAWYDNISAWTNNQPVVKLGTDNALNRASIFGNAWPQGPTRASVSFSAVYNSDGSTLSQDQHIVQPGQIAKFSFSYCAPLNTPRGNYSESFRPIVEGLGPMNNTGTWMGVTVN